MPPSPGMLILRVILNVWGSKTATAFSRPLVMKPRFLSDTMAMPWAPSTPVMSPRMVPFGVDDLDVVAAGDIEPLASDRRSGNPSGLRRRS